MRPVKLPFEIGQDYEVWEFDLEVMDVERIPNYDSYMYLGEVKKFLNIISDKTELIFYWDKLEIVIFKYDYESKEQLTQFKDLLRLNFGGSSKFKNEYLQLDSFKVDNRIELWLIYIPEGFRIEIAYGKKSLLGKVYD